MGTRLRRLDGAFARRDLGNDPKATQSLTYDLRYHPKVKADLRRISPDARARIREAIESRLMTLPERFGVPLQGALRPYWKLRVGDYRVLYWVAGQTVAILAVVHRKDAYEQAERRIGRR